ncbi:MAG: hypothetical protein QOH06_187 [Acidobacteriota bacterium]|nr:hypothetical protein [Acidobacteriota bacterium]
MTWDAFQTIQIACRIVSDAFGMTLNASKTISTAFGAILNAWKRIPAWQGGAPVAAYWVCGSS